MLYVTDTINFVGEVTSKKDSIGDVDNFDDNVFAHMFVPKPDPVIVAREYWMNDHKNILYLRENFPYK